MELEPEEDEEGIGEWIPQPYFGEHLTIKRWAVRTGGGKNTILSVPARGSAESGVLRQSWRRVCAARAGVEISAH
jgi:hypothetical protein